MAQKKTKKTSKKKSIFSSILEKMKNRKSKYTFTKKWVSRLMWFSCFWISCSYYLAYIGKDTIAVELSQTVCKVIIGTMLGYLTKAFFETKCEEELKAGKKKKKKGLDEMEE